MDTASLSGRQEVYAPPAHLQQKEGEDKPGKQKILVLTGRTKVKVEQIGQPGGEGPGFLGIPRPVVAPGFLGPKGSHNHA